MVEEILDGSECIISSWIIIISKLIIFVCWKTNNCRRLQEKQIRSFVPAVRISIQHIALIVSVAYQKRANFLKHTDQARAPRTTIKPNSEWSSTRLISRRNKNIMDSSALYCSIKIAGINSFANHTLIYRQQLQVRQANHWWAWKVQPLLSKLDTRWFSSLCEILLYDI